MGPSDSAIIREALPFRRRPAFLRRFGQGLTRARALRCARLPARGRFPAIWRHVRLLPRVRALWGYCGRLNGACGGSGVGIGGFIVLFFLGKTPQP